MALPSDPAETFVREVDENLRRDQMRDMAKAYGKWIVAAVVLFLIAIGGYLYWQNQQREQASQRTRFCEEPAGTIAPGAKQDAVVRRRVLQCAGCMLSHQLRPFDQGLGGAVARELLDDQDSERSL